MNTKEIRVVLIGLGLIGKERLKSIQALVKNGRKITVFGVYDPFCKNKKAIEKEFDVKFYDDLQETIQMKPDWAFIAVPHDEAVSICKKFLRRGVKVLVEKPLGRDLTEARSILKSVTKKNQLWVGFNFRFFDGIAKAISDLHKRRFGKIISVNILMGHGCDPDIKRGWKLDPVKAGGGCLIDPGIHLLDLCQLISKRKIKVRCGWSWNGFWKTGIEEECHFLLEADKYIINLQVSIVKWRSTFRIEINGDKGYGVIEGRNRSYGKQRYVFGKRWGWQKGCSQLESEELVSETSGEDVFTREIEALLYGVNSILKPCSGKEAVENMELLKKCRESINL